MLSNKVPRTSGEGTSGGLYVFEYPLPWIHKLELALGVSRGIEAFSNALPGFSHNDIKSPNFLVSRPEEPYFIGQHRMTFIAKIADVEFASKGITPEHLTRGETPNWTAPEVLSRSHPVSPASDVYSLGSVFLKSCVGRNLLKTWPLIKLWRPSKLALAQL